MGNFTREWFTDAAERVAATFLLSFLAALATGWLDDPVLDIDAGKALVLAAASAGASAVKAVIVGLLTGGASAVPATSTAAQAAAPARS